jgi:hypothetical protein
MEEVRDVLKLDTPQFADREWAERLAAVAADACSHSALVVVAAAPVAD